MADRQRSGADDREAASSDDQAGGDTEDASDSTLAGADDPLVVWALASFHTGLLVAVLVGTLYLAGPLGDLLGGLRTTVGLALYLGLWASTWWTNRRWLGVVSDPETEASASVVVGTGGKWGGIDGVCFLLLAFVFAIAQEIEVLIEALPIVLVGLVVGSLLAFAVGAIVGTLFAALDLALFRIAGRLVTETGE